MRQLSAIDTGVSRIGALAAAKPKDLRFPIVVREWRRNAREVWRISLDEYKGVKTIDLRAWWTDANGILKPGKSGLTAALKHLPQLATGIEAALSMATELGLLNADD